MPFIFVLYTLIMIVAGLLAVLDYLGSKYRKFNELAGKLIPIQGGIGITLLVFSIIAFIKTIEFISMSVLLWVGLLLPIGAGMALGLIMGINLLGKMIGSPDKAATLNTKLVFWQIPLGWITLGYGLFLLLLVSGGSALLHSFSGMIR